MAVMMTTISLENASPWTHSETSDYHTVISGCYYYYNISYVARDENAGGERDNSRKERSEIEPIMQGLLLNRHIQSADDFNVALLDLAFYRRGGGMGCSRNGVWYKAGLQHEESLSLYPLAAGCCLDFDGVQ